MFQRDAMIKNSIRTSRSFMSSFRTHYFVFTNFDNVTFYTF